MNLNQFQRERPMSKRVCKISTIVVDDKGKPTRPEDTANAIFPLNENVFYTKAFLETYLNYVLKGLDGYERQKGLDVSETCKQLNHVRDRIQGKRYTLQGVSEVRKDKDVTLTIQYREEVPE